MQVWTPDTGEKERITGKEDGVVEQVAGALRRVSRRAQRGQHQVRGGQRVAMVEPQELVKKSGGLEKASAHWHAIVYANKLRADGHVKTILPEHGVLRKRPNGRGQHHDP